MQRSTSSPTGGPTRLTADMANPLSILLVEDETLPRLMLIEELEGTWI